MGDNSWEETLHDCVQENITEVTNYERMLYYKENKWLATEPPKNHEETKELCLKVINLIQNIANKRGKTLIIGDQVCGLTLTYSPHISEPRQQNSTTRNLV